MKAVKLFFEAYMAGVFVSNPTQGYRAIRTIDGFHHITSKFLKGLEGPSILGVVENPVDALYDLTLTIIEDMRQHHENIVKMNTMLREILMPIQSYLANLAANHPEKGTTEYKVRVSTGVIRSLESEQNPAVIFEHFIPVKVMRDEMICQCFTKDEVIRYLNINLKGIYITKEEDVKITKHGFKERLPETRDRYASAGIKIYEHLVYFRRGHSSMKHIEKHSV